MRWLLSFLFLIGLSSASAAPVVLHVSIGVNGLTCSMCTRSVEMSVRKLDFVDSVAMDLENTDGKVFIRRGIDPDFQKIAKAITDAGFSVRFIRISVDWHSTPASDLCFSIGQNTFQLIGKQPALSTQSELELVGEPFMPRKEALAARKMIAGACNPRPSYYVRIR
jgi:copper chaperone CopZ